MKTYLITTALLCIVLCGSSHAGIMILSQMHHVWGSNNGDIQAGLYDVSYPETTTEIPISGQCYGQWSAGHPSYAISSAGNFIVSAKSAADSAYDPQEWYSIANASSTYIFTTQAT